MRLGILKAFHSILLVVFIQITSECAYIYFKSFFSSFHNKKCYKCSEDIPLKQKEVEMLEGGKQHLLKGNIQNDFSRNSSESACFSPDVLYSDAFSYLSLFLYSTINPILYNVMSHRYRVAFRDTLCSRKRGFYSSANGFVRDQSSFRETTIAAASRDHNLNYEGSQLVTIDVTVSMMIPVINPFTTFYHQIRTKSVLSSSSHRCSRYKDGRLNNSSMRWKENNNVKRVDSVKVSMQIAQ